MCQRGKSHTRASDSPPLPVTRAPVDRPARVELRLSTRGGAIELLRLPALLYGLIVRGRGALYRRRILPSYAVDAPVISVGNLSAGGTGKTPTTVWLVRALQRRGLVPAIVSRGYRSADHGDAAGPNDEARMLASLLPEVPHVQDRDRVDAARRALDMGADVVVADDGFQHRRLARDLDIVLVDALRPWGLPRPPGEPHAPPVRALIPRGLMREPLSALRRADVVVITRADRVEQGALAALRRTLSEAAPGVPIATAVHAPVGVRALRADGGSESRPVASLRGLEVDLLSGIGNPEAFEASARATGAIVVRHRAFPDHHPFTAADLEGLGAERPVLTTAKDAARLEGRDGGDLPPRMLVLDVEVELIDGVRHVEGALDRLPAAAAAARRGAIHEGLHG